MMPTHTTIDRWCAWVSEACWVLALTMAPMVFNLYSARHFEPDKAALLRSLALVASSAALARWLNALVSRASQPASPPPPANAPPLWRRVLSLPLAVPVLLYALVYLLATAFSIVPGISFWGSYQRMQGTLTHLSYIALFVVMIATLRRVEQIERVVTMSLAAGFAVAGYGILQHQGLDPLPWRGDVITRVASTMGNSIFVAAYMIMVVPLALYRLVAEQSAARTAPAPASARNEQLWGLTRLLLFGAGLLLVLALIKFGAAVRTVDFRYWWALPGAVVCATALWWLPTTGYERAGARLPWWPALLLLGYLLTLGVQFAATASAGLQVFVSASAGGRALDWWLWLALAVLMALGAYTLAHTLPRLPEQPSRLWHHWLAGEAGVVALALLAAIFFTQSRGPWLGLGAGLFVFCSLLLWQAMRQARVAGDPVRLRRLHALLIGWTAAAALGVVFLLIFNLSQAPFIQQLREVPYIGRMGRLLEVDRGTGLVRRLIWFGDEHAGGAIALITSDWRRMLVGWGPESMFVAFNRFYPPSLANVEARGASPDRSHQALLDELVTRGLLGLASYLFLVFSAVALAWRLMRASGDWRWQAFFLACLSAIVTHVVEGLTGIPIVSTLMMFWVILALVVAGGAMNGQYSLSLAPAAVEPAPEQAGAAHAAPDSRGEKRRRAASGGKGASRAAAPRQPARAAPSSFGLWLLPALIAALALGAVWRFNAAPIVADMHFQQGQGLSEGDLDLNRAVQALDEYLQAVRRNPGEDFYYLHLGRTLMGAADALRVAGVPPGEASAKVDINDLLALNGQEAVVGFVERTSPMAMMSYAEAALLRAHTLNPLNKDHFANLGRLNSYWYSWSADPSRLNAALQWYERVTPIAPRDVTLLNERAGVTISVGDYYAANGDAAQARQFYEQAAELLRYSERLDPRYADTYLRQGDLARLQHNDPEAAVAAYVKAIELSGTLVAGSIERIADGLAGRPELLRQLRDAYARHAARQEERLAAAEAGRSPGTDIEALRRQVALLYSATGLLAVRAGDIRGALEPYRRAAELQPGQTSYRRNYAIVLSDTLRYDEALAEARRALETLRVQPGAEEEIAVTRRLIELIEQARAGG
ncbi:MAG: O-antigen ligase family protein [Oscillochloridaceae bacterium]|nr:O-antigen ligase family protein [Oscillochloridaceae bacterium]